MIIFKTRHEVRQLREEVKELRKALAFHFDILYSLDDYKDWQDRNAKAKVIPVVDKEWKRFEHLLEPMESRLVRYDEPQSSIFTSLSYRAIPLKRVKRKD